MIFIPFEEKSGEFLIKAAFVNSNMNTGQPRVWLVYVHQPVIRQPA